MNSPSELKIKFSKNFVSKFSDVIVKHYKYKRYLNFLIVPSFIGDKTLSYLPLLTYTDRSIREIDDLMELKKNNDYQIRVLNFEYTNFLENDVVTMRLYVENKSSEDLFLKDIQPRCRNKIRNSIKKYQYVFKKGNTTQDIDDFYTIFSATMHKHGTPVLSKKLFKYLTKEFQDEIVFYNIYDNEIVVASMCIIIDGDLAWYPWGGVAATHLNKLAGYFIYWNVLKDITKDRSIKIFDFGRSAFNGNTYKFKAQFGAIPVNVDTLVAVKQDIYVKYSLASKIWKYLPKYLVDRVGPLLCRYLVDL